jgi:hypothetical protein
MFLFSVDDVRRWSSVVGSMGRGFLVWGQQGIVEDWVYPPGLQEDQLTVGRSSLAKLQTLFSLFFASLMPFKRQKRAVRPKRQKTNCLCYAQSAFFSKSFFTFLRLKKTVKTQLSFKSNIIFFFKMASYVFSYVFFFILCFFHMFFLLMFSLYVLF